MTDESSHSKRIDMLADEFLARRRRGESPTIEEYCVKCPDLAKYIRELFPTLEMMETLKPSLDAAEADRGVRWDDPEFGIKWPRPVEVMSDKDTGWPDYKE